MTKTGRLISNVQNHTSCLRHLRFREDAEFWGGSPLKLFLDSIQHVLQTELPAKTDAHRAECPSREFMHLFLRFTPASRSSVTFPWIEEKAGGGGAIHSKHRCTQTCTLMLFGHAKDSSPEKESTTNPGGFTSFSP